MRRVEGRGARTCLQQRMSGNDLEEPLEALSPLIDDVLGEAVGENLAGEGRNVDLRKTEGEEEGKVSVRARRPGRERGIDYASGACRKVGRVIYTCRKGWADGRMGTSQDGKVGRAYSGRLPLERVPECLKVRVATTDDRMTELEGGDVGLRWR